MALELERSLRRATPQSRGRIRALLGAVCLTALPALADGMPTGRDINPGLLGFNALPVYELETPWVGDQWAVSLGLAGQVSSPLLAGAADVSMTTPFRLEYPFARRVLIEVFGEPFEVFSYSAQTQSAWSPSRANGITRADVSVGTRVALFNGSGWIPAVGLRVLLKTATGENLANRRFLDAPAYQFDLLVAEKFPLRRGALEAAVVGGFFCWQQGEVGQNDAWEFALRGSWEYGRFAARTELRGYRGWQHADAPVVLALRGEFQATPWLQLYAGTSWTVVDPAGWDVRFGLRVSGPVLQLPEAPPTPAAP